MKPKNFTSIIEKNLDELKHDLPKTDLAVMIDEKESIASAWQMLHRIDNIANDNVLVLKNHKPVGIFTGKNIIKALLNYPENLDSTISKNISKKIQFCKGSDTLLDIIKSWKTKNQHFSVFSDGDVFYPISPKTILELLAKNNEDVDFKEIMGNEIKYTSKKKSFQENFKTMINNKIRRLIIEGTTTQIHDRGMLNELIRSNDIIKSLKTNPKNNVFDKTVIMSADKTNIQILKELNEMKNPCLINKNKIITCLDIVENLII